MLYKKYHKRAFTLIEVMASVAILAILMTVMLQITNQTQKIWKDTNAKSGQFRAARNAFESINRRVRQVTLNSYFDYNDPINPTDYVRRSELRFISGPVDDLNINPPFTGSTAYGHALFFQAPFGYSDDNPTLDTLLNTWGYYLAVTDGKEDLPGFLTSSAPDRWRVRLYEYSEPSEDMAVYALTSGDPDSTDKSWYQGPVGNNPDYSNVLAENVVALIVRPKEQVTKDNGNDILRQVQDVAPDYLFDSSGAVGGVIGTSQKSQLPPILEIVLVAIDEGSAKRLTKAQLEDIANKGTDLFLSNSVDMEDNLILDPASSMDSFENYLSQFVPSVDYRVYSSSVTIAASEWAAVSR